MLWFVHLRSHIDISRKDDLYIAQIRASRNNAGEWHLDARRIKNYIDVGRRHLSRSHLTGSPLSSSKDHTHRSSHSWTISSPVLPNLHQYTHIIVYRRLKLTSVEIYARLWSARVFGTPILREKRFASRLIYEIVVCRWGHSYKSSEHLLNIIYSCFYTHICCCWFETEADFQK